ncbi:cytidine deaminase, partial [Streptococcus pyogenes]
AIGASKHAYVPYSHFPIGAALKTKDGTIYTGCNIENASFGLTNCGERTAIFKAVSDGHKELAEIAIYGETQEPVSPCGACRQVMAEFFEPSSLVTLIAKNGQTLETTVGDLLPYSFTDLS